MSHLSPSSSARSAKRCAANLGQSMLAGAWNIDKWTSSPSAATLTLWVACKDEEGEDLDVPLVSVKVR